MKLTKHFYAYFGFAFSAAVVSGCSGTQTNALLSGASNIEQVRYQLNLPLQGITDLPNGNKLWTFGRSSTGAMPMTTPSTGTVYGAYGSATYNTTSTAWVPVNYTCTLQIETTSSGQIRQWQGQGNSCP